LGDILEIFVVFSQTFLVTLAPSHRVTFLLAEFYWPWFFVIAWDRTRWHGWHFLELWLISPTPKNRSQHIFSCLTFESRSPVLCGSRRFPGDDSTKTQSLWNTCF
jgi:hypothetical protein